MNTEDDAELALKISNALTQALLEHRQNALRAVVSQYHSCSAVIAKINCVKVHTLFEENKVRLLSILS